MFNLANIKKIECPKDLIPVVPEIPSPIEGVDLIEELLPVSKVTGHRGNTLSLLQMSLSPKYQGLIPQLLQELPTISSDKSLSDEDRCNTLAVRLITGSPAEQEQFASQLMNFLDGLTPQQVEQKVEQVVETPETSVEVNPE